MFLCQLKSYEGEQLNGITRDASSIVYQTLSRSTAANPAGCIRRGIGRSGRWDTPPRTLLYFSPGKLVSHTIITVFPTSVGGAELFDVSFDGCRDDGLAGRPNLSKNVSSSLVERKTSSANASAPHVLGHLVLSSEAPELSRSPLRHILPFPPRWRSAPVRHATPSPILQQAQDRATETCNGSLREPFPGGTALPGQAPNPGLHWLTAPSPLFFRPIFRFKYEDRVMWSTKQWYTKIFMRGW